METREDRTDVPGDAPLHAEKPAPRPRLRSLAPFAVLAGLFAAALAGSWLLRNGSADDEPPTTSVESADLVPKKKDPTNAADTLERGDQALVLYRFARARAYYEELLQRQPEASPLVAYRIGLCNEALGQLDKAQAAYRSAIGAASSPALTLAAQLGTARCLLREHYPADARRLLSPVLLDEARQRDVPAPLLAGMRYLIALALAEEAMHAATTGPADASFVAFTSASLEIPFYFDDLHAPAKPPDAKKVSSAMSLKKQTAPLETIILYAEQDEQPVCGLLDRVAKEAGLNLEWTAEAKKQLEDRTMRLAVRDWAVIDVLQQAADRFDLTCQVEKDAVRISTAVETDAKLRLVAQREAARRALRAALQCDANHPWAAAAMLELGIAEASDGKHAKAAIWFERLLRNAPASAQAAPAAFNLALLHADHQEHALARKAWYRAIDHAPGHELALRAYLRIARSHLEQEDPKEAIVQLRRAQNVAPGSPYRPVAALLLAAAHLQKEEPEQARLALAANRTALLAEPHKSMAVFLNAYAEFQLARPTRGGRREATDLLHSLWLRVDDNPLGPIGHALIARAYFDLGFCDQAEQRLRLALAQTRGPFVAALEYQLAETLLKQDRRADAAVLFEKLAGANSSHQGKARYQLAQLDLQEKRFAACEEKCRRLWADGAVPNSSGLLQTWGAALDGMGEHAKAAQCYAGKAPQ